MTTTDPLFGMLLAFGGAPGQPVSPLIQLIPFALVLAIFYFVILLPMKNRQKKVEAFLSRSRSATRSSPPAASSARSPRSATTPCNCRLPRTCASTFPGPPSSATRDRRPLSKRRTHKSWRRTFVGKSSSFSASSRSRSGRSIRPTRRCKLGLDLKGGVQLVLRVQTDDALQARDADHGRSARGAAEDREHPGRRRHRRPAPTSFTVTGVPAEQDAAFRNAADRSRRQLRPHRPAPAATPSR